MWIDKVDEKVSASNDSSDDNDDTIPKIVAHRLPSQTVSFTAAEIVTVQELIRFLKQQQLQPQPQPLQCLSVRFTGVLISRDDPLIWEIADPFDSTARQRSSRTIKSATTFQSPLKVSTTKTSPLGGRTKRVVFQKPALRKSSLALNARPLLQKHPVPMNASKTTLLPNPLQSRKRPLPGSQKSTRTNSGSNITLLRVNVKSAAPESSIANICLQDLVMVIGEVNICNHHAAAANMSTHATQKSSPQLPKNAQVILPVIQARIIRNVNGTDMALYGKALELRRKHLITQWNERNRTDQEPPSAQIDGSANEVCGATDRRTRCHHRKRE